MKIRRFPAATWLAVWIAPLLASCATSGPPMQAALAQHKVLALIEPVGEPYLMLERRPTDGTVYLPSGSGFLGGVAGGLINVAMEANRTQTMREFTQAAGAGAAANLRAQYMAQMQQRLTAQGWKVVTVPVKSPWATAQSDARLQENIGPAVRSACPDCTAALLIDPVFGLVRKYDGFRPAGESIVVLLALAEAKTGSRMTAEVVDEKALAGLQYQELLASAAELLPRISSMLPKLVDATTDRLTTAQTAH